MRAFGSLCLLLAALLLAGGLPGAQRPFAARRAAAAAAASAAAKAPAAAADPLVCVVIRTYWAHGSYGDNSLPDLLWALARQTHANWEALVLIMDNRPFPDLHHILRYNGDARARVFAEWISAQHAPRTADGSAWAPGYHDRLYQLTDKAIRACPRGTEWLVVTNGDNDYDPAFLARVIAEGARHRADAVAFDYYSRFQRPTGTPCERFAAGDGLPPCKRNLMRWCHTDLAATAYRWRKLVGQEGGGQGLLFGGLDESISHDGRMAEEVVRRGWKVARVTGECLVEHAPSPQACAQKGGVWDDRDAASDRATGGRCVSGAAAAAALAAGGVEEVTVNASHDASLGLPAGPLPLRCLRRSDRAQWAAMRSYFPAACAAPEDGGPPADALGAAGAQEGGGGGGQQQAAGGGGGAGAGSSGDGGSGGREELR